MTKSDRQLNGFAPGLLLFAATVAMAGPAFADDASAKLFSQRVAAILTTRCLECHATSDPAGGLDLSRREAAFKGGESGEAAIVPGKPSDSALLAKIAAGEMPPPDKKKPLNQEEVAVLKRWIESGADWPQGRTLSVFDFTTDKRAGRDWWSLQPLARAPTPAAAPGQEVRNPIDAFVLARLAQAGLQPAEEADRVTLIRRASLDLLGLPPTPEEVDQFLADDSPHAWERLVDRLLASPRHGERWGRHWLDVVGWAETDGFEVNTPRANAWPYRDYVIDAFNRDLPYSRFILDQLAGDTTGAEAATGFLVGAGALLPGQIGRDEESKRKAREDELATMITATGTAFLGLSVNCARCHDHKFDVVTQQDYTAIKAAFAGVRFGERPVKTPDYAERVKREPEIRRKLALIDERFGRLRAALIDREPIATVPASAAIRPPVHAKGNSERFPPVRAKYVRFVTLATNRYEPCIDELEVFASGAPATNIALATLGVKAKASSVYADGGSSLHRLEHINDGKYGNGRSWIPGDTAGAWVMLELPSITTIDRVAWARDREGKFADRLPTAYRIEVAETLGAWRTVATEADRRPYKPDTPEPEVLSPDLLPPDEARTYRELLDEKRSLEDQLPDAAIRSVFAGRFEMKPSPSYRLHRGDPEQRREVVGPGAVAAVTPALSIPSEADDVARRVALARWLADPHNPLTARVAVNRVWRHHFGHALTRTPVDLGWHGGRPENPALVDWLAGRFIESGGSLKRLHRLIMTSAAYRRSSRLDERAARVDRDNALCWRYSPRRLEAESIRDSILAISGNIDLTMGGPGYSAFKPNDNYVRVYDPKVEFSHADDRRMVYQTAVRMRADGTFGLFDCPDAGGVAPKRNVSTTPLQALNLLNSPFMTRQATLFAARLQQEMGPATPAQIDGAFRLAFGRLPEKRERDAAIQLATSHGLESVTRAILAANELFYIP